jgi:endonuclease YncB( thermonuclease family)
VKLVIQIGNSSKGSIQKTVTRNFSHKICRASYLVFCLVLIFQITLFAEDVKIVKVLDSNLFEIKGGMRIRLANVDAPSISDSLKRLSSFAYNIKSYAERQLLGRSISAQFIQGWDNGNEPFPVHLIQHFPLKTVSYNKLYLERGFGKYVNEGDTSYIQEYLAAEETAKRYKRGVWNEALYFAENQRDHVFSLLFGSGNYEELNGYYREVSLNSEPLGNWNGFGIRATGLFFRDYMEYGNDMEDSKTFWLRPFWIVNYEYAGIEPGIILFRSTDEEFSGSKIGFFVWPSIRINMGYMKRIYLSFDYFTDLLYSPATFGLNYHHNNPYLKFWLGYTPLDDEKQFWSLKIEGLVTKKLLVKVQGIYYNYFQGQESSFGWRVGIGYVID